MRVGSPLGPRCFGLAECRVRCRDSVANRDNRLWAREELVPGHHLLVCALRPFVAAITASNAEERSTAWQERHTPERFQDVMPWQLPERLWHRYHRQEIKYADRLARADAHSRKADDCAAAIRRLRAQQRAQRPKQTALF